MSTPRHHFQQWHNRYQVLHPSMINQTHECPGIWWQRKAWFWVEPWGNASVTMTMTLLMFCFWVVGVGDSEMLLWTFTGTHTLKLMGFLQAHDWLHAYATPGLVPAPLSWSSGNTFSVSSHTISLKHSYYAILYIWGKNEIANPAW